MAILNEFADFFKKAKRILNPLAKEMSDEHERSIQTEDRGRGGAGAC